jgi:hypothetical protein
MAGNVTAQVSEHSRHVGRGDIHQQMERLDQEFEQLVSAVA